MCVLYIYIYVYMYICVYVYMCIYLNQVLVTALCLPCHVLNNILSEKSFVIVASVFLVAI